jgi:hypothetical protein
MLLHFTDLLAGNFFRKCSADYAESAAGIQHPLPRADRNFIQNEISHTLWIQEDINEKLVTRTGGFVVDYIRHELATGYAIRLLLFEDPFSHAIVEVVPPRRITRIPHVHVICIFGNGLIGGIENCVKNTVRAVWHFQAEFETLL